MISGSDSLILTIVLVWLAILTLLNFLVFIYYKRLVQGVKKKNVFSILEKLLKDLKLEVERTDDLGERIKKVEANIVGHVQKVGLIRFNPFAETGGNQSFCLALLDANDNGLVVSSLHSRSNTRVYAKPIKEGEESGYAFSEEEQRAIKRAKK